MVRGIPYLIAVAFLLATPAAARAQEAAWTSDTGAVVYGVAIAGDGELVVAGRRDNAVAAYAAAGELRWEFATEGTVYDVAVDAAGRRVAAASEDRHVYLLDEAGQEVWRQPGRQTFTAVSISGDGGVVAAGTLDRQVRLFDGDGTLLWQYTAGDEITDVLVYGGEAAFRVVAGTDDSRVVLLSGEGRALWERTLSYPVRALAVTANGARVAAGDERGIVTMLDGASGDVLWTVETESQVNAIAFDAGETSLVAGTAAGELWVLSAEGARRQRIDSGGGINDLALLPATGSAILGTDDALRFVVRGGDGAFQIERPVPRYVWIGGAALAVVAALAVLLGLRRRPTGERAWRAAALRQRRLARQVWRARVSYLFLVPTVTLLLIFNYYPAISGIVHAFTVWSPGVETRWVGLDQFRALADDRYFWTGIGNLVVLILTGFLKLILPLLVAEMIFHLRSRTLRYVMRTGFVLQVIVPGVVGILLWVNIYDPNIGLANQTLRALGFEGLTRVWLGDGDTALWAIVFMGFPWVSAFALLIFYGGLISIPGELFDAAEVDGASVIRRFFNIDLPLLLSQVRLLVILTFIAMVQEFAAIFLTTGGGPGSSTYVPSLELYYQAVRFNNFGLASAIGAVLFVVILGGTILNLRYVKSSVEYTT